jgi:uncharacterized protein (DUF2062 family)
MIMIDKVKRWARFLYLKLFRINDTPLKIALGFGLGAFVGVMPGVGPVVALMLAFLFRVNRVSALLGSILFNTWVGLVALLLAVKVGAFVMGRNYQEIYTAATGIFKDFKWEKLWDLSVNDVLLPIGVGFLIISACVAVLSAVVVYAVVIKIRSRRTARVGG